MKYFLVGYMACGKTCYGREMAERLGIRFIDLDRYIEERERCGIPEIFAAGGEEAFRKRESRYLQEVCELYENFVLSTGGGTPCFNQNMEYMNRLGETIFLNTDREVIVERLLRNRHRRPLLDGLESGEVRAFVNKHLEERLPFYLQAQRIIG